MIALSCTAAGLLLCGVGTWGMRRLRPSALYPIAFTVGCGFHGASITARKRVGVSLLDALLTRSIPRALTPHGRQAVPECAAKTLRRIRAARRRALAKA